MASKEHFKYHKDKHDLALNDSADVYSNFSLNKNHKHTTAFDQKSSKSSEIGNREKSNYAYENFIETQASDFLDGKKLTKKGKTITASKDTKQHSIFAGSSFNDLLEFPRQQENDPPKSEVQQFSASQKLFRPTQEPFMPSVIPQSVVPQTQLFLDGYMTDSSVCTGGEPTETIKMSTSIISQSQQQPPPPTATTFDSTKILDNGNNKEEEEEENTEEKSLQIVEEMEIDENPTNAEEPLVEEIQDENHISAEKIESDNCIPKKEEMGAEDAMEIDVVDAAIPEEEKEDLVVEKAIENNISKVPEPSFPLSAQATPAHELAKLLPFENLKLPTSEFDYKRYLNLTSSEAAEHPILYSCHNAAIMSIFNAIFVPDMSVKIVAGEHENKEGIIKCICFPTLTVETKELVTIHVNFSDIQLIFDGYDIHFWIRYVDEGTANKMIKRIADEGKFQEPLHSFVKESQYLEIINDDNPEFVETGKVLENRCGLLKVGYGNGKEEYIHMTSPRLKPLGWADFVVDDFTKGRYYIESDELVGVAPFCFDISIFDINNGNAMAQWMPFSPHRIDEGHVMVVIDPETNFQFFPAIVTEVFNRFFYRLSIVEDCSKPFEQWKAMNRCISSSDIFPFGQGHRDKCSTALPKGISTYDKLTVEEISRLIDFDCDLTPAPTNRFPLYNLVSETQSSSLFEFDNDGFNDPGLKVKLSRQLIEVYLDDDYSAIHFGRILRTTKHFLFVSIETFGKYSPPKIFSLTNPNVFPLGYAEKYQIPVYLPHVFLEPMLQPIHIEKLFTANPLLNDGRDYMSPSWLDGKKWCPKLYINRKCFTGPFIDSKRIWRLENSYGPGPLPKVLECLISDLVTCCEGSKLMHIFDAKKLDGVFTYPAKYYSNSDNDRQHSSTNVVNFTFVGCKNVNVLPQWLNILCRMIDACPGFINTKEIKCKCIYDCSVVPSSYPYMLPETHVNVAYSNHVAKDRAKQKKRRTIVEQLRSNSPRPRRSRINASSALPGEESDEDSRSSSPIIEAIISRRRTISTSLRPTIIRPIKPTEVSSDSSSDDDVVAISDEDEIPQLARETSVNEFNHRNNGNGSFSNSPTFPAAMIHHSYAFQRPAPPRQQFRTTGPKIRYASQQLPPFAIFNGPIMDPRKVYLSRPQHHSNHPVIRPTPIRPSIPTPHQPQLNLTPVVNRNFRIDPATGKYMTSSSFNHQQKVSPPTVSPTTIVTQQQEPQKDETPPPPGEAFPIVTSDPRNWKVASVSAWIAKSLEKDFDIILFKNRVSGMQLLKLTTHDLSQMGIPFGRALKLQDLIRKLRIYTEKNFGNIDEAVADT